MNNLTWFGWLYKGRFEVSFLDYCVMFGEMIGVIGIAAMCALVIEIASNRKSIK